MATYDIGDLVRVSGTFQVGGSDTDPTAVTIKHLDPSGNLTTWLYLTDPEVIRDAVGQFHADIDIDEAGQWWYRFEGTGAAQAAGEETFFVDTTETA